MTAYQLRQQIIKDAFVIGIVLFVVVPLAIPGLIYMTWSRR